MADGITSFGFSNEWIWLIFVVIGLVMVLLELIIGVEAGFDLVFLGSAFVLGGLVTWPLNSWILTIIITSVICLAYVAIGRRYVHRWKTSSKSKTNIDAIIGKTGVVMRDITRVNDGLVKVGNEQWRARAEEEIKEGEEITVISVSGVTLIVEKTKGGN